MNFLNLNQSNDWTFDDWSNWMNSSVRSTEGGNVDEAEFVAQAVQEDLPALPSKLRLVTKIVTEPLECSATFQFETDGVQFAEVPIRLKGGQAIRSLRLETVGWAPLGGKGEASKEPDAWPDPEALPSHWLEENPVVFEKIFPYPKDGASLLVVTNKGDYNQPPFGKAVPLWAVGGVFDPWSDLNTVESWLATPRLNPQHPKEAEVLLVPLSRVLKKAPLLLAPSANPYRLTDPDMLPWNLVQSLEMGEARLTVDGQLWKSTQVTALPSSREQIVVTFEPAPTVH